MDRIIFAIIEAPPILRWIILIPLSFIGVVLVDFLCQEKWGFTPFISTMELFNHVLKRFIKYSTIGAFMTLGGLLILKLISH